MLLVSPSTAQQQASFPRLKVTVSPPRLTADAGTYAAIYLQVESPDGKIIAAPRDVPVTLASSVLKVASTDQLSTIPRGLTYAVASLTTTATPGVTNITAASPGFAPASVAVTTVSPSGTAVKLAVSLTPQTLLPQSGGSSRVFIQLQDAGSKPARASSDTTVALASSQIRVANVTPSILIRKGSTYGTAIATVSFAPGVTTITASASGLATGFGQLSVVGPSASKLSVKVVPSVMAAGTGERALIAVQLEAADGTPTPAPAPVVIQLTSSATNIGMITASTITIQAGGSWATSGFVALGNGVSTVTGTAQGVVAGSFPVTVTSVVSAGGGSLSIALGTPTVLSDRGQYSSVVVQLTNNGTPMVSGADATVFLASSNSNIGTIQPTLLIPRGSTFGVATFTSTLTVGSTTITASASNFASSNTNLNSAGPVPNKLAVIPGPVLLIADGEAYSATSVQVQDMNGNPAKAPDDITVTLASSDPVVGDVSHTVLISSGSTYGFVTFQSTLTPGATQITASAPGYVSGQNNIVTTSPSESALAVYEAPSTVPADSGVHNSLIVQVQDVSGLPVKADLPLDVFLTSSDPSRADVVAMLQIPAGSSYAVAQVKSSAVNGSAIITAQAQGLSSASLFFQTSLLTMLASVKVVGGAPVTPLATIKLVVNVSSGGYPLSGVNTTWSADDSFLKLINASQMTDSLGKSSASFFLSAAGNGSINVLTSKSGFASRTVIEKINARQLTLSIALIPTFTITNASVPTSVLARVTSNGKPIANASIVWSSDLGSVNPAVSVTDRSGSSTVSFVAPSAGTATISAGVSAPGYSTTTQTVKIAINGAGGPLGLLGLFVAALPFLPYLGASVVAIVLIGVLVRRRGKRGGMLKEGKEEETEEAE